MYNFYSQSISNVILKYLIRISQKTNFKTIKKVFLSLSVLQTQHCINDFVNESSNFLKQKVIEVHQTVLHRL